MKEHVSAFTTHLKEAISIAESTSLNRVDLVKEVLILGLGGSGIGGTVALQVLSQELTVPVLSCRDYKIPAFVSDKTLIIASSYSGNTEETLSALKEAELKTKLIFCITAGGKLAEIAKEKGYGCIQIPSGIPPRGAFGYSFPQLFKILETNGLIKYNYKLSFENAISFLDANEQSIISEALKVGQVLKDKMAIIYAQSDYEGVCIRFRQQLNENSKKLCWHHVIPEMNHNELVGWREKNENLAVVLLRNETDLERNQFRMDLSKETFRKYCSTIIEINSKGENKLEQSLYLIHLCDWISVFVAEANKTDAMEIEVINYLKGSLAKK